jgi:hypothetical protein
MVGNSCGGTAENHVKICQNIWSPIRGVNPEFPEHEVGVLELDVGQLNFKTLDRFADKV